MGLYLQEAVAVTLSLTKNGYDNRDSLRGMYLKQLGQVLFFLFIGIRCNNAHYSRFYHPKLNRLLWVLVLDSKNYLKVITLFFFVMN